MKLRFEIELLSDYHVSAGHGLGATIDSALFRDSDGIPVLRGTTLAGLLRDGMRDLLHAIGRGAACCPDGQGQSTVQQPHQRFCSPNDPCPVCRIFGSPAKAKQWRISSARPHAEATQRKVGVRSGVASEVVNRSSTDLRRRRTIPNRLFNREVGTSRLRFRFDVTGPSGETASRDAALIVAAARMVRHLGQARRRGSGECLVRLVDDQGNVDSTGELLKRHLEAFQRQWLEVATPSSNETSGATLQSARKNAPWKASQSSGTNVRRFQLLLVTREPVLVGAARQAGNEIGGMDCIPGSALLGAFAGKAAGNWSLGDVGGDVYKAFVNIFRRGGVTFPMLYPATRHGDELQVAIPAPRDLVECRFEPLFKQNGRRRDGHRTQLSSQDDFVVECPSCGGGNRRSPLDRIEGYINLATFRRIETRMREEMHVHIDPNSQTAAEGDLFSYWTIDAGQHFYGELLFENDRAVDDFQQLVGASLDAQNAMTTSVRLGRASRRGYGLVEIELREFPWSDARNTAIASRFIPRLSSTRISFTNSPNCLTLTFLTDSILTDRWGRYLHAIDETWLLNECFAGLDVSVNVNIQCADTTPTGGFFAHIGLPRQREIAIAAGSTVGFELSIGDSGKTTPQDVIDRLDVLEKNGVGLRRHEGFGRVAFNHPVYGCDGLTRCTCEIPVALRLSDQDLNEGSIQSVMRFIDQWRDELGDRITADRFADHRWAGMGQWLMTQDSSGMEGIIELLKGLASRPREAKTQDRDTARPGDPRFLFGFTADPFRATNYFADEEKGLSSLRKLIETVEQLKNQANGQDRLEKLGAGLRMLSGALIEVAKSKKE